MEITAALAADLHSLTEARHDDSTAPFETAFEQLAASMEAAVTAYLGLSVTLFSHGHPVTFTALEPAAEAAPGTLSPIVASARLPVAPLDGAEPGSVIIFYAGRAGAFVDWAADVSFALGVPLGTVAVDEDLTPPSGPSGLEDLSLINQAVGILLARGLMPDQAHVELRRRARDAGQSLSATAQQLLEEAQRGRRTDLTRP